MGSSGACVTLQNYPNWGITVEFPQIGLLIPQATWEELCTGEGVTLSRAVPSEKHSCEPWAVSGRYPRRLRDDRGDMVAPHIRQNDCFYYHPTAFRSTLPDWNFHTFADNVAYSGHSGLLSKAKRKHSAATGPLQMILWACRVSGDCGWQPGADPWWEA